jgi:beta-glucanase (GH16 family)
LTKNRCKRTRVGTAVAVATCALVATMVGSASPASAASARADEFTGTAGSAPDSSLWRFETGGGGWGNNEKQTYTDSRDNSRLDGDGNLLIQARRSGDQWTSARLSTKGKFSFTFGTLSARIAFPHGAGLAPAFWLLGTDIDSAGFPAAGEIDLAETINDGAFAHMGVHGPTAVGGAGSADLGPIAIPGVTANAGRYQRGHNVWNIDTADFHTYSVTKTAGRIVFSVDGTAVYTLNRSDLTGAERWVFDKPMYAILNLAVGGVWPGATDDSTPNPSTMKVDHFRYTP